MDLVCHGLADFLVAVAETGYSCPTSRIKELGAIFQVEVAAFPTDRLSRNEPGVAVEDRRVAGGDCVHVSDLMCNTLRVG